MTFNNFVMGPGFRSCPHTDGYWVENASPCVFCQLVPRPTLVVTEINHDTGTVTFTEEENED